MDTKDSILEVLRAQGTAMSMAELIADLSKKGVRDETATKAALWALIADTRVELTPERALRPATEITKT